MPLQIIKHPNMELGALRISGRWALAAIFWLLPALSILVVREAFSMGALLWIFGALSVTFGVWAFLTHGGPQVTGAGMFSAATAVFIGYSAMWWHDYLGGSVEPELVLVTVAAYFSTVVMYLTFWWNTRAPLATTERDGHTARWATVFGMALAAVALILHTVVPPAWLYYTEDAAFVGIVIFSLGLTGGRGPVRVFGMRTFFAAVLVVWFVAVAFDGFGRLPVLALLAAVGIVFSMRQKTRLVKLLAVIMVPVASMTLTVIRSLELNGALPVAENKPDSDVGGLWTFARLVADPNFELGWGDSFWATFIIWVPRAWWPEKPNGLGTELTALLEPHLLPYGHSMVATVFGEWFWNFGWWGLPLMVGVVGWSIRWLDQHRDLLAGRLGSRHALLGSALLVAIMASITDFVWNGANTFAARMLIRTAVLVVLLITVGNPLLTAGIRASRPRNDRLTEHIEHSPGEMRVEQRPVTGEK